MVKAKSSKAVRDRLKAERRLKIKKARAAGKAAPKPQPLPPDQQFPGIAANEAAFHWAFESVASFDSFRAQKSDEESPAAVTAWKHGQLRLWCQITTDIDHLSQFISDWSFMDRPEEVQTLACQRLLELHGL